MATTSVTRSTRRIESGVRPRPFAATNAPARRKYGTNPSRNKRQIEHDHDYDVFKAKKPRLNIAVELPVAGKADARSVTAPPSTTTIATTTVAKPIQSKDKPTRATKTQSKTAASLKNELSQLQAVPESAKPRGRQLRSQEATRFKSELSAYFPEYDEVIGNDPKEHHILNPETVIVVTDSSPDPSHTVRDEGAQSSKESHDNPSYPVRGYSDSLFTNLHDAQRIDFSFLYTRNKGTLLEETLPDSTFEPAHKKAERLEKSIRNSEKGRAQHEKDHIIRLLGALQGPDWLRVLGVSGITESKKRTFEPARDHFITGCQTILDKFRSWAAEEKRRKLLKGQALAEAALDEEEDVEKASQVEVQDGEVELPRDKSAARSEEPPESDVDASEMLCADAQAATGKRRRTARAAPRPPTPTESQSHKPFTSFFEKRYQRDAALTRRRKGRLVMAWGHVLPEVPEKEFSLPDELHDEEALKSRARRKRREKRDKP